jgi:formate hydrogenlyase subunit 4
MAYEPMVILSAVGMYMVTKSFAVADIATYNRLLIFYLPGIFLGFVFILTIKFRKSPFDLSMSHHAHQEIVRGILTEFSGQELAMVEIAHWYENLFLLGFVYLFFAAQPILALAVVAFTYFLEIFIDNNSARLNWQMTIASSWLVAAVLGTINLVALFYL